MRRAYFAIRAKFIGFDSWLRFLGNSRIPGRLGLLFTYWKLLALKLLSPGRTRPVKILRFRVAYVSLEQLTGLYKEIFIERIYAVETDIERPVILDAGANIGIATLYFKSVFPDAKITCVEPDPVNFRVLRLNIELNQLTDVETLQVAVGRRRGTAKLYFNTLLQGDNAQSLSKDFRESVRDKHRLRTRKVKLVKLADVYPDKVDILKIDVEGAEEGALQTVARQLRKTGCVQMEYHYDRNNTQLENVLRLLEKAGHTYSLTSVAPLRNQNGSVGWLYSTPRSRQANRRVTPLSMLEA